MSAGAPLRPGPDSATIDLVLREGGLRARWACPARASRELRRVRFRPPGRPMMLLPVRGVRPYGWRPLSDLRRIELDEVLIDYVVLADGHVGEVGGLAAMADGQRLKRELEELLDGTGVAVVLATRITRPPRPRERKPLYRGRPPTGGITPSGF